MDTVLSLPNRARNPRATKNNAKTYSTNRKNRRRYKIHTAMQKRPTTNNPSKK